MRRPIVAALAAFFALAAACNGDGLGIVGTGTVQYDATGTWGTTAAAGGYDDLVVDLAQDSTGAITGFWSGTLNGTDDGGTLTGTNTSNAVRLTLGDSPITFFGRLRSPTRMTGTLTVSGANVTATFTKTAE
ncbi:MAG TPA: hypothetical protein VHG91_10595 [Longimicrobium sp.]|nr:hypothetical protein [Longimicrobium sp.]